MKKPVLIKIKKTSESECEVTFHSNPMDRKYDYEFQGRMKQYVPRHRPQKYGFFEKDELIKLVKIG